MAVHDPLLDSLTSDAMTVNEEIADLEQQQEELRLRLATTRALRSELLGAADALNRQRIR